MQALVDLDREAGARRKQRLLRRANLAVRPIGDLQRELQPSLVERIERRYAKLETPRPKRWGRKKRRPGHNLALRLRNCRESVLRFLQADQDVRMIKVRQKISGGLRSE